MDVQVLTSLAGCPAEQWNALDRQGSPFLRHEFLAGLERHGCADAASGWHPQHLVCTDGTRLLGAMPLYLRDDSWGEFVFDWSWAEAWHRAGLPYYPKLTSAVPYTPATGPRLLVAPDADRDAVTRALVTAAIERTHALDASSLHVLFPAEADRAALHDAGLLWRRDCQFHWHNDGFADFDAFLATFSSAKRKKVRRERRRVTEGGVSHRVLHGGDMTPALWEAVYAFSARTFMRRGRPPYLSRAFFEHVGECMGESLVVIVAELDARPIAAAICFRGHDTLYGRYWGALGDFHSLHFETCYYQGIDYCIREGLARFEPGTQGEHKVSRGFTPVDTWSAHWLADTRFRGPVADFLQREDRYVRAYMSEVSAHVPFRRGD